MLCTGQRTYNADFTSNSVLYQRIIYVKFECCHGKLLKALTFSCKLPSVGLESIRTRRIPNYYWPKVIGEEIKTFCCIRFRNNVASD